MAQVDFSKLKKLPPEMRIKALQKLEQEINKLITVRQKEIEEAKALLAQAKHEQELIEEIETPKVKEVEVQKLFERKEAPSIEKKAELERLAEEAPGAPPSEQADYARFMAQEMSVDQIHHKLYEIRSEQSETGVEKWYQRNFVDAAAQALELKKEHGNYVSGSKKEATLTAAERLVNYLK
ncbi:hypothetical protein KY338_01495 [Candidatus Woesearchaeota archaeon]|nr:hypothetical protein [Candidatus Woesearchaeota archaeon]MBW3005588.1 hypothetical protein [Candidatus Woesearchaeota archaeon]